MTPGTALAALPLFGAAVADCRRREIPSWTIFLIVSCAATDSALGARSALFAGLNALFIGGFLLCAAVKCDGMGGGDVKLCAAMAMLTGLSDVFLILALALATLIAAGKVTRQKRMPFAPFLLGAFLLYQLILQRR